MQQLHITGGAYGWCSWGRPRARFGNRQWLHATVCAPLQGRGWLAGSFGLLTMLREPRTSLIEQKKRFESRREARAPSMHCTGQTEGRRGW